MAEEEKPKSIKVTYNGDDSRPNGMLGGSIPVKGKSYIVPIGIWESKNQEDWKVAKKATKKVTPKKKPVKKKD